MSVLLTVCLYAVCRLGQELKSSQRQIATVTKDIGACERQQETVKTEMRRLLEVSILLNFDSLNGMWLAICSWQCDVIIIFYFFIFLFLCVCVCVRVCVRARVCVGREALTVAVLRHVYIVLHALCVLHW